MATCLAAFAKDSLAWGAASWADPAWEATCLAASWAGPASWVDLAFEAAFRGTTQVGIDLDLAACLKF